MCKSECKCDCLGESVRDIEWDSKREREGVCASERERDRVYKGFMRSKQCTLIRIGKYYEPASLGMQYIYIYIYIYMRMYECVPMSGYVLGRVP